GLFGSRYVELSLDNLTGSVDVIVWATVETIILVVYSSSGSLAKSDPCTILEPTLQVDDDKEFSFGLDSLMDNEVTETDINDVMHTASAEGLSNPRDSEILSEQCHNMEEKEEDGNMVLLLTKTEAYKKMSSYARVLIELQADVKLKDNIVEECTKNTGADEKKNVKQPYSNFSRCSGVEPTIEVSNSNPFDVLNSVDNDVEFGTNGRTTNLVNNEATSSGSSFMNIDNDGKFDSHTPIGEKNNKIKRQIYEGNLRLMDNDGNPLVLSGIVKSDSEVEVVFDETANLRISRSGKDESDKCYGVKLSDASKKLGKKFATGASVVKGPIEKDQIDVQGDIAYDIVDFITHTWPDVSKTAIYFIEDGKKVPAIGKLKLGVMRKQERKQ
nr:translation machinery-associated protein 22-like [Tanacetum cinerariifolium]